MKPGVSEETRKTLLSFQKNEITEHIIYSRLARSCRDKKNCGVLARISEDELRHYKIWKKYTGADVMPKLLTVWKYYLISIILGITFGIKLMENGEKGAQKTYRRIAKEIPEAGKVEKEEEAHERGLIAMIREERLDYVGSIVLGLNDALVELTGALAGLTFALQNATLVALAGLVTGIAAAFSMGASEYLSSKAEGNKNAGRSSLYTGVTYMITVALLVAPFLLFSNLVLSLASTLAIALVVIFLFTFYISVAKDLPFRRRFLEMAGISMGVAGLSFLIGLIVKAALGIGV
jgi:VIT1/CCC1 family predicted Fe2+/Mn2+ transporter